MLARQVLRNRVQIADDRLVLFDNGHGLVSLGGV